MREYNVQIKETLVRTVTVEAENAAQARQIVERHWKDSEYILDADHFQGVSFTVPPKIREYER